MEKNNQKVIVRSVFWRYGGGLLVMLATLPGLGQAVRASRGHMLMHEARFGDSRHDPDAALLLYHQAHRQYPYSYHMAINAATLAWEEYVRAKTGGDSEQAANYLDTTRYWTRIGLYRNPYPIQLRWLNQRLLEIDDSIEDAIHYWEKHTAWHFWYAYNHAVLADLYTRSQRFKDAERALRMLRGSPYYAEASEALDSARTAAAEAAK